MVKDQCFMYVTIPTEPIDIKLNNPAKMEPIRLANMVQGTLVPPKFVVYHSSQAFVKQQNPQH